MARRGKLPGPKPIDLTDTASKTGFVLRAAVLNSFESWQEFVDAAPSVKGVTTALSKFDTGGNLDFAKEVDRCVEKHQGPHRSDCATWWRTSRSAASHLEDLGDLPSRFFLELSSSGPPRSKPEVIVRAMALVSYLDETDPETLAVPGWNDDAPLARYGRLPARDLVDICLDDLAIVASGPAHTDGLEATALFLAMRDDIALPTIQLHIDRGSPLAWRLLRTVAQLVEADPDRADWGRVIVTRVLEHHEAVAHPSRTPVVDVIEAICCAQTYSTRAWAQTTLGELVGVDIDGRPTGEPVDQPVRVRIAAAWLLARLAAVGDAGDPRSRIEWTDPKTAPRVIQFAEALRDAAAEPDLQDLGAFVLALAGGDPPYYPALGDVNDDDWEDDRSWWSDRAKATKEALRHSLTSQGIRQPIILHGVEGLLGHLLHSPSDRERIDGLRMLRAAGLSPVASKALVGRLNSHSHGAPLTEAHLQNLIYCLGWLADPDTSFETLVSVVEHETSDDVRATALMALGDMANATRKRVGERLNEQLRRLIEGAEHPRHTTDAAPASGLLMSALYCAGMFRDEGLADHLDDAARRLATAAPTTAAMAKWGVDRIAARQIAQGRENGEGMDADESDRLRYQAERELPLRAGMDQEKPRLVPEPSGALRRLSHPLAACRAVADMRAG